MFSLHDFFPRRFLLRFFHFPSNRLFSVYSFTFFFTVFSSPSCLLSRFLSQSSFSSRSCCFPSSLFPVFFSSLIFSRLVVSSSLLRLAFINPIPSLFPHILFLYVLLSNLLFSLHILTHSHLPSQSSLSCLFSFTSFQSLLQSPPFQSFSFVFFLNVFKIFFPPFTSYPIPSSFPIFSRLSSSFTSSFPIIITHFRLDHASSFRSAQFSLDLHLDAMQHLLKLGHYHTLLHISSVLTPLRTYSPSFRKLPIRPQVGIVRYSSLKASISERHKRDQSGSREWYVRFKVQRKA